jgi:FkbM family methyltransferase
MNDIFSFFRKKSFGLNGLDLRLAERIGSRNGFFVEAGANDGVSQSNTLYFEKYRGWRGLLIEPVPELFEKCRRNRPKCMTENAALVSSGYRGPRVAMRYCNLMSTVKGALKTEAAEFEHVREGCAVQNVGTYEFEAPARTLGAILTERGIRRVDLLSLDVEGYEADALKGLDFDKHRPERLLVEARFRADVDAVVSPLYRVEAEFPPYDVLYRLKAV